MRVTFAGKLLNVMHYDDTDKDIRVDVAATDTSGQRFIVELQLARQEAFYERAIFNSSFAVQQQVKRGNLNHGLLHPQGQR